MTSTETVWENARKEYVQGITQDDQTKHFPTYNEVAKKYDLALGTVKNKGSTEKWPEQRKRYKFKVTKKAQEKKGHDLPGMDPDELDAAAEIDAEAIIQEDEEFEKTGSGLRDLVQEQIDLLKGKPAMVNPYHLKMLGDALSSAQGVVKAAQEEILERGELEVNGMVKTEQRYKHTIALIGSNEFLNHEVGLLNAVEKKQSQSK